MKPSKTAAANRVRLAILRNDRIEWAEDNGFPDRAVLSWSPQRFWQTKNRAAGRCYSCNRKRVTKNLCGVCRDRANAQKRERRAKR